MKRDLDSKKSPVVTARYSRSGGGSGEPGRTTENIALRELDPARQREFEAVQKAIKKTSHSKDGLGHWRNEIIRLIYFTRTHNLHGAAAKCHVSFRTAQRWQREFFTLVENYLWPE